MISTRVPLICSSNKGGRGSEGCRAVFHWEGRKGCGLRTHVVNRSNPEYSLDLAFSNSVHEDRSEREAGGKGGWQVFRSTSVISRGPLQTAYPSLWPPAKESGCGQFETDSLIPTSMRQGEVLVAESDADRGVHIHPQPRANAPPPAKDRGKTLATGQSPTLPKESALPRPV